MKKALPIIACILLVLSIIGNIYLYMQNGDISLSLQKSQGELSSAQTTLSEKETELSDANAKIEELEGTATDLQSQITDLEKELKELKDKLSAAEQEKAEAEKKETEGKAAEEAKAKAKTENTKITASVPAAPTQDIPIMSDDEFGGAESGTGGTQDGLGHSDSTWGDGVILY